MKTYLTIVMLATLTISCNFHEERGNGQEHESAQLSVTSPFAELKAQLFHAQCASCHNPGRSAGGVDLTTYESIRHGHAADGEALIDESNADASLLIKVLVEKRMPPRGNVENNLIALLQCWIASGGEELGGKDCVTNATPHSPTPVPLPSTSASPPPTPTPTPAPTPSQLPLPVSMPYAMLFEQVIVPACVGCHEGEFAAEGVDLSVYDKFIHASAVFGDVNNPAEMMPLVVAANPEQSLLWKVACDDRMPYGGDPLSAEHKELIKRWIEEGAKP